MPVVDGFQGLWAEARHQLGGGGGQKKNIGWQDRIADRLDPK